MATLEERQQATDPKSKLTPPVPQVRLADIPPEHLALLERLADLAVEHYFWQRNHGNKK